MKKTVLLFGGSSGERLVSVASAQNLTTQYPFSEIWYLHPNEALSVVSQEELLKHKDPFQVEFKAQQKPFANSLKEALPQLKDKTVFMALHGTQGEDGTIQGLFEMAKVPFTGSDSASSRLAFEKDKAKVAVTKVDIAVAPEVVIEEKDLKNAAVKSLSTETFGNYLLERFIQGRELTIGVFHSNNELKPLPPSEVVLNEGHSFDYQGKYLGRGTTEITPAVLTQDEIKKVQEMAMKAHKAMGCYGYSRTDVILTSTGPVFLETNTLPGLTKASFIPQQLAAAGLEFRAFIEGQLTLAASRPGAQR